MEQNSKDNPKNRQAEKNIERYKLEVEQRRLYNQKINQKSVKLHLIWLIIFLFVIIIGIAIH